MNHAVNPITLEGPASPDCSHLLFYWEREIPQWDFVVSQNWFTHLLVLLSKSCYGQRQNIPDMQTEEFTLSLIKVLSV